MNSVSNILLEKEILLESGTNELEILVFAVADFRFGINVAKVREVLPFQEITSLPKAHEAVLGVFQLRDRVVPCVSLKKYLGIDQHDLMQGQIVLTDFNHMQTAFTVEKVERIHRISWEKILAVPSIMQAEETPVTAVAMIDNKMISMLDFEYIAGDVMQEDRLKVEGLLPAEIDRSQFQVLVADDSPSVRMKITSILRENGYTNLQVFENGDDCWQWMVQRLTETQNVQQVAHLVISDVEMPQMDGFHLTQLIKQHNELAKIPVCLFSSIVSVDNQKKGEAVGANAQLTKPDITKTIQYADQLIANTWDLNELQSQKPNIQDVEQRTSSIAEQKTLQEESQVEIETSSGQTLNSNQDMLITTYREELRDRLPQLNEIRDQIKNLHTVAEFDFQELSRILHNIKSASQVIPIRSAIDLTHVMEDQILEATEQPASHVIEKLNQYIQWIHTLAYEEILEAENQLSSVKAVLVS